MSTKTAAHVTIDLDGVREASPKTVEAAIIAFAKSSETTASGVVGMSWEGDTSPGGGRSRMCDSGDFARRAVEGGALHYIDATDGRMISSIPVDIGSSECPDDVIHDLGGNTVRLSGWSRESVVRIECPSIDEAIDQPEIVAEMARSVIDYHGPMSDRKAWGDLIRAIQEAAKHVGDIELDDFAENNE